MRKIQELYKTHVNHGLVSVCLENSERGIINRKSARSEKWFFSSILRNLMFPFAVAEISLGLYLSI